MYFRFVIIVLQLYECCCHGHSQSEDEEGELHSSFIGGLDAIEKSKLDCNDPLCTISSYIGHHTVFNDIGLFLHVPIPSIKFCIFIAYW